MDSPPPTDDPTEAGDRPRGDTVSSRPGEDTAAHRCPTPTDPETPRPGEAGPQRTLVVGPGDDERSMGDLGDCDD